MLTIITQCVACIISVYQAHTENKKGIYLSVFLFNMSCLLVYLTIGDYTSATSYILITVRSYVYLYKDKLKKPFIPYMFIGLHIVTGLMSINNPWQIISIITPSITCWYMWFCKKTQQLRIGNIICAVVDL